MTIPLSIPSLRGDRITLRPFTMDDAPAVYDYLATPEIASTTLHVPYPYPAGSAEGWIATHRVEAEKGTALTWAITLEDGQHLIGAIGVHLTPAHVRGEIGYWLGVPHWNQGFTTEAARLVVNYGVDTLDLHRIQATCLPHNVGSSRVMEKAGLAFEGILRGYIQRDGIFEDIAMYAMIPSSGV
jgi:ribosomal-protein-alanine N-acetyltransferase